MITYGSGCNVIFSPDGEVMVCAVPATQEPNALSSLQFFKVFEPTLKPLYCLILSLI